MELEIKVYLGNLGVYNEGSSRGRWITLPVDDIQETLKTIGVEDGTRYEEYHIEDFECPYFEIQRYDNLDSLNDLAESLSRYTDEQKKILVKISKEYSSERENLEEFIENLDGVIVHQHTSLESYGRELVENYLILPDDIKDYIDYARYAEDNMSGGNFLDCTDDADEPCIIELPY